MYLGVALPPPSCGTLRRNRNTALHSGRNLAVSPPCRHGIHLMEVLVPLGIRVTARIPRLSADGRYPLPCSARCAGVSGLSSRGTMPRAITFPGTPTMTRTARGRNAARLPAERHRGISLETNPRTVSWYTAYRMDVRTKFFLRMTALGAVVVMFSIFVYITATEDAINTAGGTPAVPSDRYPGKWGRRPGRHQHPAARRKRGGTGGHAGRADRRHHPGRFRHSGRTPSE